MIVLGSAQPSVLDVCLPPANLGLIRDLVITAWNRVLAECGNCIELLGIQTKNGIEYLEVKINNVDSLIKYLNKNSVNVSSINDFVQNFSNCVYNISGGNINLIIGPIEKPSLLLYLYYIKPYSYAFGRGLALSLLKRYKIKREKPSATSGMYFVRVSQLYGFFFHNLNTEGPNNAPYSVVNSKTYLLIADPIMNSSIAHEIMGDLYVQNNSLKVVLWRVLKNIRGQQRSYPVLQDFVGVRLLLELIERSITSSIIYTSNLPAIRVYLSNGIQGDLMAYQIIEISPSVVEATKMAFMTSSSYLDMRVNDLIRDIKNMIDAGIRKGKYVNDSFAFVNSIFQGRPDIDLYYQLKRDIVAQQR